MNKKLVTFFIITIFLSFIIEMYRGGERDYRTIVLEIRSWNWLK